MTTDFDFLDNLQPVRRDPKPKPPAKDPKIKKKPSLKTAPKKHPKKTPQTHANKEPKTPGTEVANIYNKDDIDTDGSCRELEVIDDISSREIDALIEQIITKPFNLKNPLTVKELKFIEFRLSGNYTIDSAMVAAGYEKMNQRARYFLASKIVQKYETQAGDHRKIMRQIGMGELKILLNTLELMEKAQSEVVRMAATAFAGKALGMHDGQEDTQQGIAINILRASSPAKVLGRGHGAAGKPSHKSTKQITK